MASARAAHRAPLRQGSLAQCDVIHLTLTEAALRGRQARLARALVAERTARKPASRLNRLLQQRLGMHPREYEWRAGATAASPIAGGQPAISGGPAADAAAGRNRL
jgi:hypothetical protein